MNTATVVTYNIRHAVLDDDCNAWAQRRSAVLGLLRTLAPDVLALQESTGEQQADVSGGLPAYDWVGVADDPGTGEHNPIGVAEPFDVVSTETEWLSETPSTVGSVGWDADYARALTRATIITPDGDTLSIFNSHFDHRGPQARVESARMIRRRIDSLPADRSAVVLGDFNCSPGSDPYDILTGDGFSSPLHDARRTATEVSGPATTVTDFSTLDDGRILDHVFVTGDVTVSRYETVDKTDADGRYPSDHLPVAVTVAHD